MLRYLAFAVSLLSILVLSASLGRDFAIAQTEATLTSSEHARALAIEYEATSEVATGTPPSRSVVTTVLPIDHSVKIGGGAAVPTGRRAEVSRFLYATNQTIRTIVDIDSGTVLNMRFDTNSTAPPPADSRTALSSGFFPQGNKTEPRCDGVAVFLATGKSICRNPGEGVSFQDCANCPEMVVVPAGSFMMGSPIGERGRQNDEKQHRVRIAQPFAVGKFEVTFDEWQACVDDSDCEKNPRPSDDKWGRERRPVVNVTWHDAKVYADWLSRRTGITYRLLKETEWEYAARATTTGAYSFSGAITTSNANYQAGPGRTIQVDTLGFPGNPWGLHHVHGNVSEWVSNCYVEDLSQALHSLIEVAETLKCERVFRGGSWRDLPRGLRSAKREKQYPGRSEPFLGFRVARTLNP